MGKNRDYFQMYNSSGGYDSRKADLATASRLANRSASSMPHAATPSAARAASMGPTYNNMPYDFSFGDGSAAPSGINENPIFPFNIDVARQLLSQGDGVLTTAGNTPGSLPMARYGGASSSKTVPDGSFGGGGGGSPLDLNEDQLTKLHLDVSDYVDSLHRTLRDMYAQPNAKLSRRLRETSDIPAIFLYFRTQQAMLRLTGDLSVAEERNMLHRLSELLDD